MNLTKTTLNSRLSTLDKKSRFKQTEFPLQLKYANDVVMETHWRSMNPFFQWCWLLVQTSMTYYVCQYSLLSEAKQALNIRQSTAMMVTKFNYQYAILNLPQSDSSSCSSQPSISKTPSSNGISFDPRGGVVAQSATSSRGNM